MENPSANHFSKLSPQTSRELGADDQDSRRSEIASADVLADLYELLSNYAPAWYTEHHHARTENALRMLGRL